VSPQLINIFAWGVLDIMVGVVDGARTGLFSSYSHPWCFEGEGFVQASGNDIANYLAWMSIQYHSQVNEACPDANVDDIR